MSTDSVDDFIFTPIINISCKHSSSLGIKTLKGEKQFTLWFRIAYYKYIYHMFLDKHHMISASAY